MNSKEATHYSSTTHAFTSIDLSIAHAAILSLFTWRVITNPYGSDHYPVMLERTLPPVTRSQRAPRWKFNEADWARFEQSTLLACTSLGEITIDDMNELLSKHILAAAIVSIPMTSSRLPKRPKPWWNNECSETRKKQNQAWGRFRRYPTQINLIEFKKRRARARYVRRQSKRTSFQAYASSINSSITTKELWDRIRKVNGIYRAFSLPLLTKNGLCPESLNEQADILGAYFEFVSSSEHYSATFQQYKVQAEKKAIKTTGGEREPYNTAFTLLELQMVLLNSKPSAEGPDGINYHMLMHLHPSTLEIVLFLFNRVWQEGLLPLAWKNAHIIPILKPGKDPSKVSSYRPIASTSCLGKTFERMVNKRLMYILEKHGLLDRFQCGFRPSRSTIDHLVRLETTVREAFVNRQFCMSVFFDLEKAYDTAWRHGILIDLYAFDIRGQMLATIKDYLKHRTFHVKLGTTLSREFLQENGVPQGGVLSLTLFIVKINSLACVIPKSVQYSLYVDDIQIYVSSCNFSICERRVQLAINNVVNWADRNGFKFSTEKTACVTFSRKRGVLPEPSLTIYGQPVQNKTTRKFLGLMFDQKLTFICHI